MHRIGLLALSLATTCLFVDRPAFPEDQPMSPSFDCSQATNDYEHAICNNKYLSQMDAVLSLMYRGIPKDASGRHEHKLWNKLRKDCHADVDCIFNLQMRSYNAMNDARSDPWPPWLRNMAKHFNRQRPVGQGGGDIGWGVHLPKQIGACVRTTFTVISDRFGGDPRSPDAAGMSALLSNGGFVTTYGADQVLISSRVGDPVEMCLTSLPDHCPPDDERGKEYSITNLRTHGRTILPDAQHMCGGP